MGARTLDRFARKAWSPRASRPPACCMLAVWPRARRGSRSPALSRLVLDESDPRAKQPWNRNRTNPRIWFPGSFPGSGPATPLTERKYEPVGILDHAPPTSWTIVVKDPGGKDQETAGWRARAQQQPNAAAGGQGEKDTNVGATPERQKDESGVASGREPERERRQTVRAKVAQGGQRPRKSRLSTWGHRGLVRAAFNRRRLSESSWNFSGDPIG